MNGAEENTMSELAQRAVRAIAMDLGVAEDAVIGCADLRTEFGMDSLDEIELCMSLEDEFAIEIPDSKAAAWKSTADVIAYIEALAA